MPAASPLALAALALATSVPAAPPNAPVNGGPVHYRPYYWPPYYYPPYNRLPPSPSDGIPLAVPPMTLFQFGASSPMPFWATYSGPMPGIPSSAFTVPLGQQQLSVPAATPAGAAAAPFVPAVPVPAGNAALPALPLFGAQAIAAAPGGNGGFAAGPGAAAQPAAAAVDQVLQLLNSPRDHDRIDAAIALGRSRVEKAVDPLDRMLQNDPSPRVREAAARALGMIGTPACLKALEAAAQADENAEVRRSARFAAQIIRGNTR